MAIEGPQVRYARAGEDIDPHASAESTLKKALDLARKLEELLEDTRSPGSIAPPADPMPHPGAHSTRMARAMAAGLVDELEALVRPVRNTGSS